MKTIGWLALAMIIAAALAAPATFSGEKAYKKCTMDTQACLDTMAAKLQNRGWVGIEMDDSKGQGAITVTRVVVGSPAEAAGFKTGDILVSVNGARFADNTEDKCLTCDATKDKWTPGTKVQYVVSRNGKEIPIVPTLAAMPRDVMAQFIGMHMLDHAKAEVAQK